MFSFLIYFIKFTILCNSCSSVLVLHCLEHVDCTGGISTLVDGYYGALRLKEEHPEDYKLLTTLDIEAEFIEEGLHHRHSSPVIRIDNTTKEIVQIRCVKE